MSTTEKGKRSGKSKDATAEEKSSQEALDFLLAEKKAKKKSVKARRAILQELYGSLAGIGPSVDEYLAEKRAEVERENR